MWIQGIKIGQNGLDHPELEDHLTQWRRTKPENHGDIPSCYLTVCHGKSPFLIGKPSINRPFSMAMLNNQRVNRIDHRSLTWTHLDARITGKPRPWSRSNPPSSPQDGGCRPGCPYSLRGTARNSSSFHCFFPL